MRQRPRYALRQLVAEVEDVFPYYTKAYGAANALGVWHSATFYGRIAQWLCQFDDVILNDERVDFSHVTHDEDGVESYTVYIRDSNRLADDAREFGVAAAADILGFERPFDAYPEGDDVST